MTRLDGAVCVVTGASSGIGRRCAEVLSDAGAAVVCVARRQHRLDELARARPRVAAFACDVRDEEQVAALGSYVDEQFGHVDVLVNAAGTARPAPVLEESVAAFRDILESNLVSTYSVCRTLGARMVTAGAGAIVNVASIFGIVASAPMSQASYCASKAAIIHLTRELAVQWARKGVRVNAIAPGPFRSEMTAAMLDNPRQHAWLTASIPMARVGEAHELDDAVLFLASPSSSFVTGHTLVVDGGWTLR